MTKQYKIGDKVLVEAEIIKTYKESGRAEITLGEPHENIFTNLFFIRPYTPRQEFEWGEIVEVRDDECSVWIKAWYIGKTNYKKACLPYIVNMDCDGLTNDFSCFKYCRKPQPRETITIGGVDYYKDDVEKALKDLKQVGESK